MDQKHKRFPGSVFFYWIYLFPVYILSIFLSSFYVSVLFKRICEWVSEKTPNTAWQNSLNQLKYQLFMHYLLIRPSCNIQSTPLKHFLQRLSPYTSALAPQVKGYYRSVYFMYFSKFWKAMRLRLKSPTVRNKFRL